jgi:arsenate reductase-like glutaredoxin family protein
VGVGHAHHHLRHQELRHDEEGARLARQARRRLRLSRLQDRRLERAQLEEWAKKVGWDTLLNRTGTTFRKLPDKDKNGIDGKKAIALMLAQPSMIKRPVLDLGRGKLLVGFAPETYGDAITTR